MKLDREVLSVLVGLSLAVSVLGLYSLLAAGGEGFSWIGLAGPDGMVDSLPSNAYTGQILDLTVYVGNMNPEPILYRVEAYWATPHGERLPGTAWQGMIMVAPGGEESLSASISVDVPEGEWRIVFELYYYDGKDWAPTGESVYLTLTVGGAG